MDRLRLVVCLLICVILTVSQANGRPVPVQHGQKRFARQACLFNLDCSASNYVCVRRQGRGLGFCHPGYDGSRSEVEHHKDRSYVERRRLNDGDELDTALQSQNHARPHRHIRSFESRPLGEFPAYSRNDYNTEAKYSKTPCSSQTGPDVDGCKMDDVQNEAGPERESHEIRLTRHGRVLLSVAAWARHVVTEDDDEDTETSTVQNSQEGRESKPPQLKQKEQLKSATQKRKQNQEPNEQNQTKKMKPKRESETSNKEIAEIDSRGLYESVVKPTVSSQDSQVKKTEYENTSQVHVVKRDEAHGSNSEEKLPHKETSAVFKSKDKRKHAKGKQQRKSDGHRDKTEHEYKENTPTYKSKVKPGGTKKRVVAAHQDKVHKSKTQFRRRHEGKEVKLPPQDKMHASRNKDKRKTESKGSSKQTNQDKVHEKYTSQGNEPEVVNVPKIRNSKKPRTFKASKGGTHNLNGHEKKFKHKAKEHGSDVMNTNKPGNHGKKEKYEEVHTSKYKGNTEKRNSVASVEKKKIHDMKGEEYHKLQDVQKSTKKKNHPSSTTKGKTVDLTKGKRNGNDASRENQVATQIDIVHNADSTQNHRINQREHDNPEEAGIVYDVDDEKDIGAQWQPPCGTNVSGQCRRSGDYDQESKLEKWHPTKFLSEVNNGQENYVGSLTEPGRGDPEDRDGVKDIVVSDERTEVNDIDDNDDEDEKGDDHDITTYEETDEELDAGYGRWSRWGPCSKTCNLGRSLRTRQCLKKSGSCMGPDIDNRPCKIADC